MDINLISVFPEGNNLLERVQRHVKKFPGALMSLTYKKRLNYLKLPPLNARRNHNDLIETFKISVSGHYTCRNQLHHLYVHNEIIN